MNENGQRLLKLCCHHNLCITSTYFKTKPEHRVSWRYPGSKHWHQLDLAVTIETQQPQQCSVDPQLPECRLRHRPLPRCKVKLQSQRIHRANRKGKPRINTNKTWHQGKVDQFCQFAFIDLTKASDLVSRGGLFRILAKSGCPPTLLGIIQSFHEDTDVLPGTTSTGATERWEHLRDTVYNPAISTFAKKNNEEL